MKSFMIRYDQSAQFENVVLMENVSSCEYFLLDDNEKRPVLEGIDLLVRKGEAWGITGRSSYEIKLLLEIMANIRPYEKGRCVLIERGMLRRKRLILKHVFYICTSEMLYNNMNVLEFLVFAMKKLSRNTVELQHQLFEFIIDIGLGYLSLTLNKVLTKEERAVVTLIAAAYSDSAMIVFNFPDYDFNDVLVDAISKIALFAREKGKSLILGTKNSRLIEKACSHTAVIADGKIIFKGDVREFCVKYDNIAVVIRDKNLEYLQDVLLPLLAGHKLTIKDGSLLISTEDSRPDSPAYIFSKISEAGIFPEYMHINPKTVSNALEEIFARYDLQKQLL